MGKQLGNIVLRFCCHQGTITRSISLARGRSPQRCFNCGSYNHDMGACPQPRDQEAISAGQAGMRAARLVDGERPASRCGEGHKRCVGHAAAATCGRRPVALLIKVPVLCTQRLTRFGPSLPNLVPCSDAATP